MDVSAALGAHTERVELDGPKVYHIPQWEEFGDPKRMDIITNIAKMRGRDPRIATLAVDILKKAGVQPRDYMGQSKALLNYVQNELYYVNEPGERLSDPLRTLKVGYGDCDDLVITLGALLESIRLPWRVVISGNKGNKKVRYHHGDKFPGGEKKGYIWSHIYMMIGDRPFTPQRWYYAETTVRGAPLGWDVVDGDASIFPELTSNYGGTMYGASMQLSSAQGQRGLPFDVLGTHSPQDVYQQDLVALKQAPDQAAVITKGVDVGGQRRAINSMPARTGPQEADMVAIVVMSPSGQVLALQRGAGVSWMAGRWDLPGGPTGGKFAREAAVEALARETGLIVRPEYLRKCSLAYHPSAGTSAFYVYQMPKKQEIIFRKLEHQGYQFVSRGEILSSFRTAPYVEIALRACFKPSSLETSPELKGKSAAELSRIAAKKRKEQEKADAKADDAISKAEFEKAQKEKEKAEKAEYEKEQAEAAIAKKFGAMKERFEQAKANIQKMFEARKAAIQAEFEKRGAGVDAMKMDLAAKKGEQEKAAHARTVKFDADRASAEAHFRAEIENLTAAVEDAKRHFAPDRVPESKMREFQAAKDRLEGQMRDAARMLDEEFRRDIDAMQQGFEREIREGANKIAAIGQQIRKDYDAAMEAAGREYDEAMQDLTRSMEALAKKIQANYGGFEMDDMKLTLTKKYAGIPLWMLLAGAGGAYYYYNHMR